MKYAISIIVFLVAGAVIFFKWAYLPAIEKNALYEQKIGVLEHTLENRNNTIANLEKINSDMKRIDSEVKEQKKIDEPFNVWTNTEVPAYAKELFNRE